MTEYIEREAAMRHLLIHCVSRYPVSFYVGLSAAAEEIKAIPAADVVEVRHGYKVVRQRGRGIAYVINCPVCGGKFPSNEPYREGVEYCSECGKKLDDVWQNYCPNCGAKMDGDKNERK